MPPAVKSADVAVIGGGLVGLGAAEAVARRGLSCIHLAPPAPPDRRTSALMQPSAELLRELRLFETPEELGTPLTRVRIIDATQRLIRAPETLFDSAEANLDAFGWNFPNVKLAERLTLLAKRHSNLTRLEVAATSVTQTDSGWCIGLGDGSEVNAALLVGADGKDSLVRKQAGIGVKRHNFEQSALVANLQLNRSLGGESIEFHYENGPFTLVPAGGQNANLVWIDSADRLKEATAQTDSDLEQTLTAKALRLCGPIKLASKTFTFTLSTLTANEVSAPGVVLVGEAAHAFPPIGAQGLNLGLRDVAALAGALDQSNVGTTRWATGISASYARQRHDDIQRTGQVVDTLFKSLLSDFLPVQAFRAGGLWALKLSPELRHHAFQTGMGAQST